MANSNAYSAGANTRGESQLSDSIASIKVLAGLPRYFESHSVDPLPPGLIGAKTIAFGGVDFESREKLDNIEGGGLVIDYLPDGSSTVRRTVLSFNELGMGVLH